MRCSTVLILIVLLSFGSFTTSAQSSLRPHVVIETNKGDITVELDANAAPLTVSNFMAYVRSGHYDGTIFHRVIADFMIQGGGFDDNMSRLETGAPITNEADNGLKNNRGTLAMARTQDPHSAGAQFFINLKDNDFLNHSGKNPRGWGYAVFGRVIAGMDVVDTIATTPTGRVSRMNDVPLDPVIITHAREVKAAE